MVIIAKIGGNMSSNDRDVGHQGCVQRSIGIDHSGESTLYVEEQGRQY
jgi:hypothetical protein